MEIHRWCPQQSFQGSLGTPLEICPETFPRITLEIPLEIIVSNPVGIPQTLNQVFHQGFLMNFLHASFEILNIIPGIPPELLKFSPERLFKSFFGEILQLCFRKLLSGFLILFFKGFVKIIFPMLLKDFVTEFLSEISQGRVLYHLSRTFFYEFVQEFLRWIISRILGKLLQEFIIEFLPTLFQELILVSQNTH